ncbi:protein AF-10 isoform X1 [Atheta coriaria]|uniref:protein AF-10 isoform X1 n=1 Tax=Dalotia coriaria TaxID=877792 RepID=UPI0031F40170
MKDMVGSCCVCSDDRGWPENPLVYCDGQSCTVAVHQACYGIVTVPTGPWYCRKCESQERSVKVKCELCPSKYGALKRTDNSGWAHVVCALYIPEVRFGNVTTMEPIQLQLIPQERFSKVCYICEQNGKPSSASVGACMQCNKSGCKQQFHVTCAQSLGLLCEEAGNYLDNVKYCGYCQHHYSKLKKGGNVKTIPPYKPISNENQASDSSSEKETDNKSSSLGKRKSSVGSKSALNKVPTSTKTTSSSTSSSSYSKSSTSSSSTTSNSNSKSDKTKSSSSVKSSTKEEGNTYDSNDVKTESKREEKESGDKDKDKGKKRKAHSRTPTPSLVTETENSTVTKKESSTSDPSVLDQKKKLKISVPVADRQIEQPLSVTTSSSTVVQPNTATNSGPPTITAIQSPQSLPTPPPSTSHSIIQSAPPPPPPQLNSVVVSVPLHNTTLSPSPRPNAITATANIPLPEEKKPPSPVVVTKSSTPEIIAPAKMITSELSSTGLKITFEKQTINTLPVEDHIDADEPIKRSRSQSSEKTEKSKSKKRGSNGLMQGVSTMTIKKTGKSSQSVSQNSTTTFVNLAQNRETVKDSPPSSPSSESLGAAPTTTVKKRGRKSNAQLAAQAAAAAQAAQAAQVAQAAQAAQAVQQAQQAAAALNSSKDSKDSLKLFQNGVNAPHMLGNQLNLSSNMAHKMTEHLNSELEAHSIFSTNDNSNLVGPPLQHRVIASARSSSVGGSSTASGGSGLSSMLGGSGTIPQTLDQLLERQWEQGSQFLMEQAQHFDIASLLSCLHQLRAENLRLEEHVNSLLQRRDHLLAVNARLAIPLTPPATPQSNHPHTVNNIHPAVSHSEASRPRHSSGYPPHVQGVPQHPPSMENGIAPDAYPHAHRSPAGTQPPQPSPRQSSSGYASSGFNRQSIESAAGRGQSGHRYNTNQYYNSAMQLANTQQQQMVIRTDHSHIPHKPANG